MPATLKIVSAQLGFKNNDFAGNLARIKKAWEDARDKGADLVVTPELSISNYPLQDSATHPDLLQCALSALEELRKMTSSGGPGLIVGLPQKLDGGNVYNTAVLLENGRNLGLVRKMHLPNYGVFDEKRVYTAGESTGPLTFRGVKLGLLICEDVWFSNVAGELDAEEAQVIIAINASPAEEGKPALRLKDVVRRRAAETGLPLLYVNIVGGEDEVVFDGGSMAVNADGALMYSGAAFAEAEDMLTLNIPDTGVATFAPGPVEPELPRLEYIWRALVMGTRDYLRKAGFDKALLGSSGGIDSAVVAAIATDALGPANVTQFRLPSRFTENLSNSAADELARNLGNDIREIAIEPAFTALQAMLKPEFDRAAAAGRQGSVALAHENLQARIRGTTLMAISNATGAMLLSTGNKSEVAVGYATLYGDMNGGYNPLKDVYKMDVYALAQWRNTNHARGLLGPKGVVIPQAIIDRAPSAELSAGQKDSDSLPPYPVLDEILRAYTKDVGLDEIVRKTGQDRALVERVITMVDGSEFKRKQSAPGPKITPDPFGSGRRWAVLQTPLPRAMRGMNL